MIDFQYLQTGVFGLANAHKAGTMAGHLGAAIAAGYFFGEDQSDLPEGVFRGIEDESKRIIAGEEAIWWNAKQAGITPADLFKPLPKEEPKPDTIKSIADALQKNVGELLAHHQHIRLWRSLPDVEGELGAVLKAEHDPRDPAYWKGMLKRDEARLTHRIKTLYGFYTLKRFIEKDAQRKKADDAFLYLMA